MEKDEIRKNATTKRKKASSQAEQKMTIANVFREILDFYGWHFYERKEYISKYIDFHEWLVVKNIWKFQVCNICEINKENSSEVYLK